LLLCPKTAFERFYCFCALAYTLTMHDGHNTSPSPMQPLKPRRKGIYALPTLFTLAALFGGFYSIVMAMDGRFQEAAIGVFAAMVLDSLDGRIARMTNTNRLLANRWTLSRTWLALALRRA
jgi:CDP-alcohol phosphatidyltransferase